jgi:hypothetical protein
MGRMIYSTAYAVSYGVVFPAMLIVRVVPKKNVLIQGFADGAQAARGRVFARNGEADMPDDEVHDGKTEETEEVEHGGSARSHRRRGGRRRSSRST